MSEFFNQPMGFYIVGIPLFLVCLVVSLALVTMCVWAAVCLVEIWGEWVRLLVRRCGK